MTKKDPMYYRKPKDRELIREADETSEGASDYFESDGYGKPEKILGAKPELLVKLRKKGMPQKG